MMYQIIPIFAQASPSTHLGVQEVLAMVLSFPTLIAIVGFWAGAWWKVNKLRLETALKQQMVDRGMSADDIVTVLSRSKPSEAGTELPCASEVVVQSDGEWHTGLILKREGERYYVHFVGTDMSDNEWVTSDRVRFPASPEGRCGFTVGLVFPRRRFRCRRLVRQGRPVQARARRSGDVIASSVTTSAGRIWASRRPRRRRAAELGADVVAGAVVTDSLPIRLGVSPIRSTDQLAEHRDEPGMDADRAAADHVQAELVAELPRLLVEVEEDFHVVGEEADRMDHDVVDACSPSGPGDDRGCPARARDPPAGRSGSGRRAASAPGSTPTASATSRQVSDSWRS